MKAVVGIDSGGTKTLAALVTASGEVLRLASTPSHQGRGTQLKAN